MTDISQNRIIWPATPPGSGSQWSPQNRGFMSSSCPRCRRCKFFTGHVEIVDHKGRGRVGLPSTSASKQGEDVSLIHSTSIPPSLSFSIIFVPLFKTANDDGADLVENVASTRRVRRRDASFPFVTIRWENHLTNCPIAKRRFSIFVSVLSMIATARFI